MRIVFGKEKCVICGKDAVVLFGYKTSYGLFTTSWFCKDHFITFTDEFTKSPGWWGD
jgi:hypothetical protein